MRIPYSDLVFLNANTKGNERLVLLAFAHRCDENGCCSIRSKEIAEMVNLGQRSVQRIIESLEEFGFLSREPQSSEDGGSLPNRYWLSAHRLWTTQRQKPKGASR